MTKHTLASHHTLPELMKAKDASHDEAEKLRLRAIINIHKGKLIKQVAEELLVSRRSVSEWQNRYNEQGLNGLKTNLGGRPEGNPVWDEKIWTALGAVIDTKGEYWSIPTMQEWIKKTYNQTIPEQTVWYHLEKLKFSYKSARPHPYKGDREKQTTFKKNGLTDRVDHKRTEGTLLFFCDEMRYGLISNYRRSWSPIGTRTIVDNQQAFSNRYLFSAVSPITGDSFHLLGFEENSSAMVKIFFDEMEKKFEGTHIVMVFDNAPSHRPKVVQEREHITCVCLPPYSPELNPAERFFGEIRKSTANQIFKTINEQETIIESYVKNISADTEKMKSLTGYEWIKRQWEEVS